MPHVQSGALLCSVVEWIGNPGCMCHVPQLFGEVSILNCFLHSVSASVQGQKRALMFQQLYREIMML